METSSAATQPGFSIIHGQSIVVLQIVVCFQGGLCFAGLTDNEGVFVKGGYAYRNSFCSSCSFKKESVNYFQNLLMPRRSWVSSLTDLLEVCIHSRPNPLEREK